MREISGILKSTRVALEAQALKTFGAAVEGSTNKILGGIFGNNTPVEPQQTRRFGNELAANAAVRSIEPSVWDSPRYAAQFTSRAMGGNFENAPKTKFLFKVSFSFYPDILEKAKEYSGVDIDNLARGLDFTIKQIDLPKFEFQYEEVNMYNFRTKILKQITHNDISLIMHDDVGNKALNLVNLYRTLHMPIARREQSPSSRLQDYGFEFSDSAQALSSSMRQALPENRNNIFAKIIIHQYYMDMGSNEPVKVNDFVFVNPRFTRIDINDQSHDSNDGNTVAITFDFDTVFMDTGQSAAPDKHRRPPNSVLKHDILNDFEEGDAEIYRGQQISPGGTGNPFIDIIARQGQRAVQTGLSNALRKAVGNNSAGRALSGAIGALSGALGEATKRAVGSVTTGFTNGISLPSFAPLRDSNTPASTTARLTKQTPSDDLKDFWG